MEALANTGYARADALLEMVLVGQLVDIKAAGMRLKEVIRAVIVIIMKGVHFHAGWTCGAVLTKGHLIDLERHHNTQGPDNPDWTVCQEEDLCPALARRVCQPVGCRGADFRSKRSPDRPTPAV